MRTFDKSNLGAVPGYKAGLRLGEAFGIAWDDVNFVEETVSINRQIQWDEAKKLWYFSKPQYNSFRTIDLDEDCMDLLRREKERQTKAKDYYGETYTVSYVNEDQHLNTVGDGTPVSLINIRENGEFIIPRTMQHTSGVIHHQLGYPDFDFHFLGYQCLLDGHGAGRVRKFILLKGQLSQITFVSTIIYGESTREPVLG